MVTTAASGITQKGLWNLLTDRLYIELPGGYRVFNSDQSILGGESKIFIFPETDFLNLHREILCVAFFSAPIDSPGLYGESQNGSPLNCRLSLNERYKRKGNLRRHERHSWSRLHWPLNYHEVFQGESFWMSMLNTDFDRKLEMKISLMKKFLGLLRNAPLPHSTRMPKEYSFQ
jgi:hypothetical protein